MAIRWSTLVQRHGFRLAIAHGHRYADEVLEIRLLSLAKTLFEIHRRGDAIVTTHFMGMTSSFPNLADALLSIVPLSLHEERFLRRGRGSQTTQVLASRARGFAKAWTQGLMGILHRAGLVARKSR